jgi:hypothetical protein
MLQSMINNLNEKTGKDLDQWLKVIASGAHHSHSDIVKYLKSDHGVTHGYANLIAREALSAGTQEVDSIAAQYAGDKAALHAIYTTIVDIVRSFGQDVEVSPKKANVSLRRSKQFALIQPSTKTRVDLGINLKGAVAEGRLEASGSFSSMVSHRVRIAQVSDVDAEVTDWLKRAYDDA